MAGEDSSEITFLNVTPNQNVSFIEWLSKEKNTVEKIIDKNRQKIHNSYNELFQTVERVPFLIQKGQDNCNSEETKISNLNSEKDNEKVCNIIKKFKSIMPTHNYKQRILNMEYEIAVLKTETIDDRNNCKSKISAHKKAIGYYESLFDIKFTFIEMNENETIAHMIFKQCEQYPIMLVFDSNNQIKLFEVDRLSNVAEYKELQNWFQTTQESSTKLIIKLRKLIMSFK